MKQDTNLVRGQIRGNLFELAIVYFLQNNGFKIIKEDEYNKEYIRCNKNNVTEIKGRGTWYQIDCPFDYSVNLSFMFPLRMIGEVKFYSESIHKEKIREFIGVIKDIQENYIVNEQNKYNYTMLKPRYMEFGVYFSASGFQKEAEKLAYAHGIKTISYLNNPIIREIKNSILELEEHEIKADNRKIYFEYLKKQLSGINSNDSTDIVTLKDFKDFNNIYVTTYLNNIKSVVTNFVATNDAGVLFHFVSNDLFPSNLFNNGDEQECRVRYNQLNNNERFFWLEFTNDNMRPKRRFYFTPPKELEKAASFGGNKIFDEKKRIFNKLSLNYKVNNIQRSLVLKIEEKWLETLRDGN